MNNRLERKVLIKIDGESIFKNLPHEILIS
jgi:hypothetical protein